jgi:SpoVK/Ycf46/Vps4 family AAA+-type ATPase
VSKHIGETEKNLARVFQAAEDSSAMLFFDEADALFGKRTQVKDAHDRYANIETSYLLQRIEAFDGVVVLATNLTGNLDDAFGRRIQFTVEFPVPDEELRRRLWSLALPASAPVQPDLDPAFLAGMFPITGGDIRSAALMAAFAAAGEGTPIGMRHVVVALGRLRRQQGKVPSPTEFRDYLPLVREEGREA